MAGTFTYPHVDTAGYAVGGQVAGDRNDPQPKFWAVLSFKDPSKAKLPLMELAKHFQAVSGIIASSLEEEEKWEKASLKAKKNKNDIPLYPVQDPDKWSEVWNVEVIYLRPGDILYVFRNFITIKVIIDISQLSTALHSSSGVHTYPSCGIWFSFIRL